MFRSTRQRLLALLAAVPLVVLLGCGNPRTGTPTSTSYHASTTRARADDFPVTVRAQTGP